MVTPKLQFSGFLFDGKRAKKQPVRIELTPVSYHSYIFRPFCEELALIQKFDGLQKQLLSILNINSIPQKVRGWKLWLWKILIFMKTAKE